MTNRACNGFLFILFLLMVAYLYMFDIPDLMNVGKIALVIVSLRFLAYYIIPQKDLASNLSVSAHKDFVTSKVAECGIITDTNHKYKACIENILNQ